uniref:Uncharacterized protein n=1 Tax=Anguilla anguilla TaxID=7936 RepID=A0A0E9QDN2_ANGAN
MASGYSTPAGTVLESHSKAGSKAVNETALSRAAMMGTTVALPSLLMVLLKRTSFGQRHSLLVGTSSAHQRCPGPGFDGSPVLQSLSTAVYDSKRRPGK